MNGVEIVNPNGNHLKESIVEIEIWTLSFLPRSPPNNPKYK